MAHSFNKIITILASSQFNELEMAMDLTHEIIDNTISILNDNKSHDLKDIDYLHTHLLIIAEAIKFITKQTPTLLQTITTEILPITLYFQQRRLTVIKGSQIKDASSFIIWSLVRCKQIPKEIIHETFKNAIACSLFDPDFLVRKASNAALQELLGRYGTLILDQNTIMKFIELPINDLKVSYHETIIKLYQLFASQYPIFWNHIINWLFRFNLMENLDLNMVKLTADAFVQLFKFNSQVLIEVQFQKTLSTLIDSSLMSSSTSKTVSYTHLNPCMVIYHISH